MTHYRQIIQNTSYMAVLLFIFSIPWENAIPVPGIGTITRALGLPLLLLWFANVMATGTYRQTTHFHILTAAYVVWGAMTLIWTSDSDLTTRQIETFIQLYILSYILWSELTTEKRCLFAMQAYVFGTLVVIFFIYANYSAGNVTRWTRRATIAGIDENDIALVISASLPIAWMLATNSYKYAGSWQWILKFFNFIYIPMAMVALVMTGSRGGFSSTIPTMIYILYSLKYHSLKTSGTITLFIIVAIVSIIQFSPELPLQRIATTIEDLSSKNVSGRWDIWSHGIALWYESDFSTIFGLSLGGNAAKIGRAAHSTPVSVLVETGVIGLLLYIAIITSLFAVAFRHRYNNRRHYIAFSITLLMVWIVGVLALSWEYRKPTWLLWSFIVTLAYAVVGSQTSNPPQEDPIQTDRNRASLKKHRNTIPTSHRSK